MIMLLHRELCQERERVGSWILEGLNFMASERLANCTMKPVT